MFIETALFYNGAILTMTGEKPEPAEAVLVENGIICALGSLEELEQLVKKKESGAGDKRTVIKRDLHGAVLMPSFIDAHSHITAVSQMFAYGSISGSRSFQEIVERLQTYQEEERIPAGGWIVGFGYDQNFLQEQRHPDKYLLDQAFPAHPVVVVHASGHMAVMNSLGLEQAGITEQTEDPEGGVIGRVKGTREPNGYMEEAAFMAASALIPRAGKERQLAYLKRAEEFYLEHGITTIQDGITKKKEWAVLKKMADQELFHADIVSYVDMKTDKHILDENREYTKGYRHHLRIGGYKIFLDGSPQGRTAWMSRPYEDAKDGYAGYPVYKDEAVERFFKAAFREGQQLLVHCNGDEAAEQMIRACDRAGKAVGCEPASIRPVMIHAQLVREDQLKEMARLSITASFFVAHVYYWGEIHQKNFGKDRAMRISPARTALKNHVNITFHQDSPVIPPDMLETVWCAVNRVNRSGAVMGAGEKISPYEALKAVTIYAARQYGEEDRKGTIEPGKLADFVILDQNPLEINAMAIKNIRVLETIKEGITLYRAKSQ